MARVLNKVIFIVLVVILSVAILGTLGLRLIGFQFRAVVSGSMEPELPVGSLVIIREVPFGTIKKGDDITFVRDENLTVITHRVEEIDKEKKRFTTRGIANNTFDAPITYENVLGKVVFCIPKIGFALSAMETTQNRIIGITVIAVLVIIWMILGIIGKVRAKEADLDGIFDFDSESESGGDALGDWFEDGSPDLEEDIGEEGLGRWFREI